jgi:small-conductance mechanosensitive channel
MPVPLSSAALLPWVQAVAILLGAVTAALILHRIAASTARRATAGAPALVRSLVAHGEAPARAIFLLATLLLVLRLIGLPPGTEGFVRHLVALSFIAAVGWLVISLFGVTDDVISARYRTDVEANLAARRMRTRFEVLRRIGIAIVVFISLSTMLMTFPAVQHLGSSLLASAGLVGIIAGVAAQRTIGNFIAGLQIALTQPIRLDDVVIVEGEWGRIEEIGTTHVVIRIWDMRRLVVPLSYFLEHPFENWTWRSAELLGTVEIHADYRLPVDEMRAELHRILLNSPLWDGNVWGLQVTESTPTSIVLRALMSARDASTAWDLRCHVREELIAVLQRSHPEMLPRTRFELHGQPEGSPTSVMVGSASQRV